MSTWAYVSSKLGNIRPETRSIAKEVFDAAAKHGHDIWFIWGMGTSPEHSTGLALDLMVHNEAAGDWVRNYIWNNRARLRLHHVIWEQHITSTTVRPGVRVLMADRGNPTANHYDHNHAYFFGGRYQPPTVSTPAASPILKPGSTGETVRKLQRFFLANFPAYRNYVTVRRGVPMVVDGVYGSQTTAWVKEFQKRTGISQTGVIDSATMSKLRANGYS